MMTLTVQGRRNRCTKTALLRKVDFYLRSVLVFEAHLILRGRCKETVRFDTFAP